MITFNQILCPIDLSDITPRQLAYAAAFARWYDAKLAVLHVAPTFEPMQVHPGRMEDPVRFLYPMTKDEVTAALQRVVDEANLAGTGVNLIAEAGDTVPVIIDRAITLPADLVVMGTHGRSGFDRFLLGSVTEKVLRQAPCPVLTIPPHAADAAPREVTLKHIVCPVDFSPSSLQALGFALDLARQGNGSLTLLHVLELLPGEEVREVEQFNVGEYRRHLIEDAQARLRGLVADEPRTWADVDEVVTTGRAYRKLLEVAAERKADLIVMGAQGRGGIGLALFGSTTQQVLRTAECPVMTVREVPERPV